MADEEKNETTEDAVVEETAEEPSVTGQGAEVETPEEPEAEMPDDPVDEPPVEPSLECRSSGWVRARRTGILHLDAHLGQAPVLEGKRLDDQGH